MCIRDSDESIAKTAIDATIDAAKAVGGAIKGAVSSVMERGTASEK